MVGRIGQGSGPKIPDLREDFTPEGGDPSHTVTPVHQIDDLRHDPNTEHQGKNIADHLPPIDYRIAEQLGSNQKPEPQA